MVSKPIPKGTLQCLSYHCSVKLTTFFSFEKYWLAHQLPARQPTEKRGRPPTPHPSEVMTLLINFHQSGYRSFKTYYEKHVHLYLRWAFPNLVNYNRFAELIAEALPVLTVYLYTRFGKCSGISFIDSTLIGHFAPVGLGMQIAHRKTAPTGPGDRGGYFLSPLWAQQTAPTGPRWT